MAQIYLCEQKQDAFFVSRAVSEKAYVIMMVDVLLYDKQLTQGELNKIC